MGSFILLGGIVDIFVSGMMLHSIFMKLENGLQSKLLAFVLLLCGCFLIVSAIGEIAPGV